MLEKEKKSRFLLKVSSIKKVGSWRIALYLVKFSTLFYPSLDTFKHNKLKILTFKYYFTQNFTLTLQTHK